jgi:hypothetical protein
MDGSAMYWKTLGREEEQEINKKRWCRYETGDISLIDLYNKMEIMPE